MRGSSSFFLLCLGGESRLFIAKKLNIIYFQKTLDILNNMCYYIIVRETLTKLKNLRRTKKMTQKMTRGQIDYCYSWLLENELFTEAELDLLTHINGYKMETLDDAVFCRYGYRSVMTLIRLDLMRKRD